MATSTLNQNKSRQFQDISASSKKNNFLKIIIMFSIILLILGFLASVLIFNIFNIREQHIRPLISNIPFVGDLLPEYEAAIPVANTELEALRLEMQAIIDLRTMERDDLNQLNILQATEINSLNARIATFEQEQATFNSNREEFDRMIAGEVPRDFMQFFASMNPETAHGIYTELVGNQQASAIVQNYISTFTEMSARNSSQTLEQMMSTNTQLVLNILEALPQNTRGSLINSMSVENRALVLTMLAQGVEF
ncbi:MAG: hypothetical protein FWF57_09355 [Defluviitaleaceae bacterium]|nr:hypothetical protein [Defluviitaleaceae bacterium]